MKKLVILFLLSSLAAQAVVPIKRSDLHLLSEGDLVREVHQENTRTLERSVVGGWVIGGDIASAGDFVALNIREVGRVGGFSAFTYDITYNGQVTDRNLLGAKFGNQLIFSISFLDGYSTFYAKVNPAVNRALYSEVYVSDRYCEYSGVGMIYLCELYSSEVAEINSGAMSK